MTNHERLRICRRERKVIMSAMKTELDEIYAKYHPMLDANMARQEHLISEIAKDRDSGVMFQSSFKDAAIKALYSLGGEK